MSHTSEPWIDDERGYGVITDKKGNSVAVANMLEDSRRIVACVNACKLISTEALEETGSVILSAMKYGEVQQQRDELLAALKRLLDDETWDAETAARAAIAKVESAA